mmetsp:Transcript_45184/g.54390  ORF Transcript_45184/g.54390 Transcript_45184/m.54390 type:complete len:143 (-) Transcript_45184:376-804(-)
MQSLQLEVETTIELSPQNTSYLLVVSRQEVVIIKAAKDSTRNLLIRAAAFDAVNRTVVCSAQEFRDITNEIVEAKKIKLGTGVVPEQSRKNPDSSSGLAVTLALATHTTTEGIKLSLQHLGGSLSHLLDGRRASLYFAVSIT